jgi:hypothetical protein
VATEKLEEVLPLLNRREGTCHFHSHFIVQIESKSQT